MTKRPIGEETKREVFQLLEKRHSAASAYNSFCFSKREQLGDKYDELYTTDTFFPSKEKFSNLWKSHFKGHYGDR